MLSPVGLEPTAAGSFILSNATGTRPRNRLAGSAEHHDGSQLSVVSCLRFEPAVRLILYQRCRVTAAPNTLGFVGVPVGGPVQLWRLSYACPDPLPFGMFAAIP
jgi:hypothetical protein